jgi:hypothetical protein
MLVDRFRKKHRVPVVEFYEQMQRILSRRGHVRNPNQTPLEFAFAVGIPEAVRLTEQYNGVRFGEKRLSPREKDEIEGLLRSLRNDIP